MNEGLFTSYGETYLVKKGPFGAASTPLDWMVLGAGGGGCAVFHAEQSPTDFIFGLTWAGVGLKNSAPNSNVEFFPYTTKQFSDTSWVFCNSSHF